MGGTYSARVFRPVIHTFEEKVQETFTKILLQGCHNPVENDPIP